MTMQPLTALSKNTAALTPSEFATYLAKGEDAEARARQEASASSTRRIAAAVRVRAKSSSKPSKRQKTPGTREWSRAMMIVCASIWTSAAVLVLNAFVIALLYGAIERNVSAVSPYELGSER